MIRIPALIAVAIVGFAGIQAVRAQTPDYASWPLLVNPFESTGGGGVMIDGYKPVVSGDRCTTDFSVRMPDGATFQNEIVFEARRIQGGVLCTDGRWRAKDGSNSGTTPFEVFIKDGAVRRSP
ncbi:MAG: hypothetical protein ACRCTI_13440 [Beijerinckiaceae bacterium]